MKLITGSRVGGKKSSTESGVGQRIVREEVKAEG